MDKLGVFLNLGINGLGKKSPAMVVVFLQCVIY